ncbi:unnamed protein product [Aureobasidium pullulans]|jgi:profilin|nr:unnamed protein product [Aureobasidium pullulans]
MKEIINGLSGKVDALYAEGLHVGGERYVLTKAEDRSLYARKVKFLLALDSASRWIWQKWDLLLILPQGREGVVIVKTKQAILIAHYGESMIAGNSATTVEQLADYLIKSGY